MSADIQGFGRIHSAGGSVPAYVTAPRREDYAMNDDIGHVCSTCGFRTTEPGSTTCIECGTGISRPPKVDPIPSVSADMLDSLMEDASIPNLGALIRRGKEKGLIKAKQGYTNSAT